MVLVFSLPPSVISKPLTVNYSLRWHHSLHIWSTQDHSSSTTAQSLITFFSIPLQSPIPSARVSPIMVSLPTSLTQTSYCLKTSPSNLLVQSLCLLHLFNLIWDFQSTDLSTFSQTLNPLHSLLLFPSHLDSIVHHFSNIPKLLCLFVFSLYPSGKIQCWLSLTICFCFFLGLWVIS